MTTTSRIPSLTPRRLLAATAFAALSLGTVACGGSDEAADTTAETAAATATDSATVSAADSAAAPAASDEAVITIEGFAFSGAGTYEPGQTITVVNADGAPHTLTADDGSFTTGTLEAGDRVELTLPTTPGTYSFFCGVHPSMTGTLTIAG